FSREGYPATAIVQGDRICVRISVDFLEECSKPNVGFIVRNRLGEDVTGTNATFEGLQLPPARAGDRISVDFVLDLPLLQQGFYYFSPAVADGTLDQYDICDWIDNACAIEYAGLPDRPARSPLLLGEAGTAASRLACRVRETGRSIS